MKEHHEQLKNHPRIALGWKVWNITVGPDLRYSKTTGALQQIAGVRWRHEHEQHIGGGYYSRDDTTTEWLDVPVVDDTPKSITNP